MSSQKIWETFQKDPDVIKTLTINWVTPISGLNNGSLNDIGYLQGRTILSSSFIVQSGITNDSDTNTTTSASITLSGGTIGQDYLVTNRISISDGNTEDRTIKVQVRAQ